MATCEVCRNDYGRGIEADGRFCCARCAEQSGVSGAIDCV
jgi:hypothetical protein